MLFLDVQDKICSLKKILGRAKTRMKKKSETSKIAKHLFTPEEDDQIKRLVSMYGLKNWKNVSRNMKGRTARQCRERWKNYLTPNLKHGPWTEAEDDLLVELVKEHGTHWAKIASHFDNRTDINLKNRWLLLQRSLVRKAKNTQKIEANNENDAVQDSSPELVQFRNARERMETENAELKEKISYHNMENEQNNKNLMIDFWDNSIWGFSEDPFS